MANTNGFTLEEMLLADTKEKIVRNAELLRIRINKNERKAVVAQRVARTILLEPRVLLQRIPFHEVLRLQQMVHVKDHSVPLRPGLIDDCITEIGLTDFRWDGTCHREFIYEDLAKVLKLVIDQFIREVDPAGSKIEREQLVVGLLNLYGVLSLTELAELCHAYEVDFSLDGVLKTVFNSYLIHSREFFLKDRVIYTSPFLFDNPEAVMTEVATRQSLSFAKFTREEVMAAGHAASPKPPESAASRVFRRELLQITGAEEDIDSHISELWMVLNNDRDPLGSLTKLFTEFNVPQERANVILRALVDWANLLPKWSLKGNSAKAIFEMHEKPRFMKQPPRLVIGPNLQKAGISVPQEKFNAIWEKTIESQAQKVGRNDPCPCGSGKKFKHCCGTH
ncbi:MAG: YecA family protein [Mangrovibacterium sp.]